MKLSAVPTHAKERKAERPAPDSRGTFYTRTFSDLPAEAKNIREEVFVREQGFTEEFDEIDAKAVHIWLIGRVAVLRAFRGKGCGKMLLLAAEQEIRNNGATSCSLHAQCRAMDFYTRCGYSPCGEPFDEEGCPHILMQKFLDK